MKPAGPGGTDSAQLVADNTDFAFDLYARLLQEPTLQQEGNLLISPFSISTALAMTYAGARGDTEREMAEVLRYSLGQEGLHPAFADLLTSIHSDTSHSNRPGTSGADHPGYLLRTANALWGQAGYGFLPEYLDLTRKAYGAGLREIDFAGATEQARQTINQWVSDRTEEKIKELFKAGDLDPSVALVLTNALYFKGSWASRFDPKQTQVAPFLLSGNQAVQVSMMNQTGKFPFARGEDADLIELPYDGDRLSMLVLLPREVDGLAGLEARLNRESLGQRIEALQEQTVRVSLPRFRVESRLKLTPTFKSMGMTRAFTGEADFSGMNGKKELFIDLIIHQTFIEVNEEGTEAAAATGVTMRKGGRPPLFNGDHPFLFLIRDRVSGNILFMGRVTDPTKANPTAMMQGEIKSAKLPKQGSREAEKKILAVLDDLDRNQRRGNMNVPREDGRLLRLLCETMGAKHVVEIGTSNGYSGIWMCLALRTTGGKLTTYEIDARRASLARENFKRAGVDPLITLIEGDAHEEVLKLKTPIDLLFLDADKSGYLDYLNKLLPLVREGGVIVAHNMKSPAPDPAFIKAITTHPDLETLFLNMEAAGVALSLKKRAGP